MELKQSSAVPFAVTDPISGLDITKDVQLVSIESVGEGDFPYFQPNGDYTFTVVNAARDEIVTPTTFTLDVPFDGEVHRLTATTDMTIQATQADFMKVSVLKPLGSVIIAPVNSVLNMELQSSYRGIDLTADDVIIQKHKPGTPPDTAYPIKFISATTKADGKTLDVKWQGADTMIGPFSFYVLRKGTTGLVEGEDWVQIDMNLRIGIAGMRIQPIHQASGSIFGHQGELINGWFTVYKDGIPIKLNDPGLTLTLVGSTNVPNVSTVIAIDERFEDHITFKILGKPTVASSNPVAGSFYGQFDLKAGYTGSEAVARVDITWVPGTDMMSTAVMQQPLFANQTQKLVTQFGPVNGMNIPPWYTIEGAKVRAGSIFVNQFSGGGIIQQVVVEPGTPLNSINQLVKEISASWMKQRVLLSGFVLDLPFITDPALYQTMWRLNAETTIEMVPIEYRLNTEVVTGIAGRYPSVLISAWQERDGQKVRIPGVFSTATVTGSLQYRQLTTTPEGNAMLQFTTRGVSGEAVASMTFRSADNQITGQTVQFTIRADNTLDIDYEPFVTSTKIWDRFKVLPFNVKVNGAIVNGTLETSKVKNIKLMETTYVKYVEGSTTEWEIVNALTTETTTRTYFTYDVEVNGVTYNCVGAGDYRIAAWDGVWLVANAEYVAGDRVGKVLTIPVGGNKDFTFYPTYKGRPAADLIELSPLSSNLTIRKQVVNEAGDGVIVTVEANTSFVTNTQLFTYKVKGIPDAELVDKQTKVFEWVNCTAVPKGISVVTATPTSSPTGLNNTLTWKPVFKWDGDVIPNNDPNITVRIIDTGVNGKNAYVMPVSSTVNITYLFVTKYPPSESTYNQYFVVDYVKDGVKYTSAEALFPVGFSKSREIAPINVILKEAPLPNKDNLIPIDVKVANNPPLDPKSIVPLTAPYFKVTPEDSDVVKNRVEYVNTGHLKFSSGYKGGDITYSMTFGSASYPNTSVPLTFTVPAAPIVVTQATDQIDGIANRKTEIRFTLSQQRLIGEELVTHNFANADIYPVGAVTGSIKEASGAFNNNGTFIVDVYGNATQGPGTITLTITEDDGDSHDVVLNVNAVIDSSQMSMVLQNNVVTGVAGDVTTITGTVKYNDTDLRWDNANGNMIYSVEPEGWVEFENGTAGTFDLRIVRNSPDDVTQVVNITANFLGMTASQPVTVNVKKNLSIEPKVFNVKVWERINGYPFVMKEGEVDITNTVLDCKPVNDNVVIAVKMENRNKPAVNMWTVKGEGVMPARTEIVTWEYRLPTDPEEVKRTIDITYNVAEFNGHELEIIPSAELYRTVYNGSFQADFYVYRKAEPATENPTNLGTIDVPCVNQEGYTNFPGQGRLTLRGKNVELYGKPNTWSIRVSPTGNVLGKDIAVATLIVSIYNPNIPTGLSDFNPNPLVGKFGEEYQLNFKVWRNGTPSDLMQAVYTDMLFYPQGILETVPGSKTKDGFKVRFLKDIDVNTVTTTLDARLNVTGETQGRGALTVTQQAVSMKLTAAPGFESTGSGDMENPVTLKQGVLNPE